MTTADATGTASPPLVLAPADGFVLGGAATGDARGEAFGDADILNADTVPAGAVLLAVGADFNAGVLDDLTNGFFTLYDDSMNLRVLSRTRSSTRCFCDQSTHNGTSAHTPGYRHTY